MATGFFKTFVSTSRPWRAGTALRESALRLINDSLSGGPIGIQSQDPAGPDAIFVPVDLTAAQIASPSAVMVADLNATYRLNVAPYTRYQSNGTILTEIGETAPDGSNFPGSVLQTVPADTPQLTIGANSYAYIYSPWTIQNAAGVNVLGRVDVVSRPA